MFLRYNELRMLIGERGSTRATIVWRAARRARGRVRAAPARLGRHGDRGCARVPVSHAVGLPREVPPAALGLARSDRRAGRLGRHRRGARARRRVARGVRPGAGRRDTRLPHDESRLGRALHEDRRSRHGRRGHGGTSGRRGARVRAPGRRRHVERDAAHHDRAIACASTAPRASSTCSSEQRHRDRPSGVARSRQGRAPRAASRAATTSPGSGSSRRASRRSSASARRPCARRCATSSSSASWCMSRIAAAACAQGHER